MSASTAPDDRSVEEALRRILEPLDRHLDRVNRAFALALILVIPGVFLILWLYPGSQIQGRHALGWAIGAFVLVVLLGLGWDALVARLARRRFDRHFPHGSPARAAALRVLAEMETPNRAEEKLREALSSGSPDRIVRRREAGAAGEAAPGPLNAPPAAGPRPGGYYDYIPLEPRTGEGQKQQDRTG